MKRTKNDDWIAIGALVPWDKNPRTHDKAIEKIANAVRRFGWGAPVLVRRETMMIIAGHGRAQAAELLRVMWGRASQRARAKWHPDAVRVAEQAEVPVRIIDCTEEQAQQLAIADNRVAEESSWNKEQLSEILADWSESEDLSALGFDERELRTLLKDDEMIKGTTRGTGAANGFAVVVECDTEEEQIEIIKRCHEEGWKCRALI